jgi:uridine kinase
MNIIDAISKYILGIKANNPLLIAIDGVDTSGKTTLADNIYNQLKNESNALRVSIDKFHNPKEIRMRQGILSPEGYYEDSFNIHQIIEKVIKPIKNKNGTIISGIFDYKIEQNISVQEIPVSDDMIVIFDGVFLNREELYNFWDLSIFLDISFDTVMERAIKRDLTYFGSKDEVIKRYSLRYIPGQKLYLEKNNPKERSRIIIDNNNLDDPIIMKGRRFLTPALI